MSDPNTNAQQRDCEIVTTRVFQVPRELAWRAWTDPEHLRQWWGPKGFTNTFHEFALHPGGYWRFTMHGPGGGEFPNESVFREIVPPEKLVFDHLSDHWFRVIATFEEVAAVETRVTFRMTFESAEECAKFKPFVVEANEQNFDRLSDELARMI